MMFNKLNEEANYYCQSSKRSGINNWDQDKIQTGIISMIETCNLTKEQVEKLGNLMVQNNEVLDMKPSNNKSAEIYKAFAKEKQETLEQEKGMMKIA